MALTTGTRLGPYEVSGNLGAGGMGEVYRARDTSLGRDVAIKVLPTAFGSDPDRRARFEREAQVLATLNHPNIGAIYGLVDIDGSRGLVLEFVDGPTLAELIEQTPEADSVRSTPGGIEGSARRGGGAPRHLKIEDTLAIATQIVEALDAAHEKGVVHRDLKPANIKVTADGTVKVLDFGLAKALAPETAGGNELANSPTITSPAALTRHGMILGTAAYMSPEQARGKVVDKRADIWAFGCVLYELLTGRRTFGGDTIADTLGAIVGREPDWSALPSSTPPIVQRLLRRCLEKDPRRRLRDVGDARLDLAEAMEGKTGPAPAMGSPLARARHGMAMLATAFLVLALAAAAIGAWIGRRSAVVATAPRVRFSILPPPGTTFYDTVETVTVALSPDGSQLAFIAADAANNRKIWLRALDAVEARPLAGTESATSVFWKPDSKSIGFVAGDKMRRLDLPNGAAVTICTVASGVGLSASWGPKGDIVFASIEGQALLQVPAAGGTPVELIKPDRSQGESRVIWPWFLPDGERFVYVSHRQNNEAHVMAMAPGEPPHQVLSAFSNVQYTPGFLLFARDSTLFALPFDAAAARPSGEAFPLGEPVSYMFGPGRAVFTASLNRVLVLQAHRDVNRLVWIDRTGREVGTVGGPGGYLRTRISPDGTRALFDRLQPDNGAYDLYVVDLGRNAETRLTSAPATEGGGTWLADGRSFFLAIVRGGPPQLFRMDLVNRAEESVLPQRGLQEPEDVSPDGKFLVFSERPGGTFDLLALQLRGDGTPKPLIQGPFDQFNARISPDGRYLAYESNESGKSEVYVTTFPEVGERVRVSVAGGRSPRWNRKALELFYLSAKQELISVSLRTSPTLNVASTSTLFTMKPDAIWRTFDVAPDGRFLVIVIDVVGGSQPLTVTTNAVPAKAAE